jgi:hypothetical protein
MVNEPVQNVTAPPTAPPQKKRHGCLTAWLIIIIIFNAIGVLGSALAAAIGSSFAGLDINVPVWSSILSIILAIAAIVCAIGLFMWKKWGFWGLIGIEAVNVIVSIIGGDVFTIVFSIIGAVIAIAILYGVLQIGSLVKGDKGWPQLE